MWKTHHLYIHHFRNGKPLVFRIYVNVYPGVSSHHIPPYYTIYFYTLYTFTGWWLQPLWKILVERIWKPWVTPYVVSCFLRNCLRKAYARAVLPYAGHSVWIELTRTLRLRVSCFHHRICLRSSTFSAWAIGVETCFEGIMLRKAINLIRASV